MEDPKTKKIVKKRAPGGGRKTLQFDDKTRMTVSIMAGCGMPHDYICGQVINPTTGKAIDRNTLEKHFKSELETGKEKANGLVAQSLFKKAIGNAPQNVTAAIFWLKCQAGWKGVEGIEHTGKDGAPLPTAPPPMSAGEFEKIAKNLIENV